MRTAIEILQEYKSSKTGPGTDDYYEDNILLAMQKYAEALLDEFVAEISKEKEWCHDISDKAVSKGVIIAPHDLYVGYDIVPNNIKKFKEKYLK